MLLPLIGTAFIALAPKTNVLLTKQIALVTTILVALVGIYMTISFDFNAKGFQFVESREWIPAFGIKYALGVDGIALVLILMSVLLTPIVVVAGWNESEGGRWSPKVFYSLLLVLETMMIGVFASTDVFLFYVFFEAMLVPVYFLIGGFGSGERAAAAVKFLLYSLFGGLLMLASIIGIYVMATRYGNRTFDITTLSQLHTVLTPMMENVLFLGFFIAFAIKAPLWPLHTWLPDAAKSATPGTSVLLLGVLDKVGTFGMIRYCLTLFPEASKTFTPMIITLAVISILYGAFLAIGAKDIKRLIAYTSISHFGFITMGIFAMTSQGMSGSTLYMFNHGFSTAALFLVAGFMITRRNSSTISDFGGLQRVTPIMAWSFFIAGLSALPVLSSFVSEFLVLVGTFTRYPVAAVIATFGIVLAALYILIPVQRALHGPTTPGNENLSDLTLREKIAIAPVIATIVVLGFYPSPLLNIINPASKTIISQQGFSDPAPTMSEGK